MKKSLDAHGNRPRECQKTQLNEKHMHTQKSFVNFLKAFFLSIHYQRKCFRKIIAF